MPSSKGENVTPVDLVIEVLGVRPLARQLKLSPSAICKWRRTGLVPSNYHRQILELAGGKITPDDLVYGR